MLIRVACIGTGVSGDSFRVPVPTYTLIGEDYTTNPPTHIIDVPDTDVPPAFNGLSKAQLNVNGNALNVLTKVAAGIMNQWYDHLDNIYQEHKGNFRPVIQ